MIRAIALLSLVVLGACNSTHELAKCRGPLEVMNADRWRPTAMEIDALGKLCPEDK